MSRQNEGILASHNRSPRPPRSQSTATADRPKRTAIYAHVSTNGQSTGSHLGDLRAYAQARNLEVTEYVDHDTGASEHPPALRFL